MDITLPFAPIESVDLTMMHPGWISLSTPIQDDAVMRLTALDVNLDRRYVKKLWIGGSPDLLARCSSSPFPTVDPATGRFKLKDKPFLIAPNRAYLVVKVPDDLEESDVEANLFVQRIVWQSHGA